MIGDSITAPIQDIVLTILRLLADSKFEDVERMSRGVRLTSMDMRQVIKEYGRTLIHPPQDAFAYIDIIKLRKQDAVSVRTPVWTKEEGRSDLTLEITIWMDDGRGRVEIEDLHVL